jgi:translation initiation factor 4B
MGLALSVVHIRIPREQEGGRIKGFGYVEFETRQHLLEALGMNEELLNNRR